MILFTKLGKPTKKLNDTVTEIISLDNQIKVLKAQSDNLKMDLKTSIEKTEKPSSITTPSYIIAYRGATTSIKVDSKRLKAEDKKLFDKYSKSSAVKSSISVKAK